ncbi:MAG TPA: hypothetical protein VGS97_20040 [Actinocrinis sp.]|uniref:hypothetical protein n=1 Tax=Actinocrinis sp. TaxID=1920516 RepID=UPI002DDDA288|nr:hypothetical protein [Actinocrinis sp.]HEV2346400.1 hypothetical protein [Actinocrinis sp.]
MNAPVELTQAVLDGIANARKNRGTVGTEDFVASVMSNICASDSTRTGWLIIGGRIMAVDQAEWAQDLGDRQAWTVTTWVDEA